MEWLKKLLEAAKITDGALDSEALLAAISTEMPKHMMPKAEYNSINEQLKTANATIAELKKANTDNTELQNKIKAHEETISTMQKDHEEKINNLKLDAKLQASLIKNKAKHPDLMIFKFDRSKLKIKDDGTVEGLDDQLKALKTDYKDLFGDDVAGATPANPEGGKPAEPTDLRGALDLHYNKK